jgi:phosphonate transport system substrate-binding protein
VLAGNRPKVFSMLATAKSAAPTSLPGPAGEESSVRPSIESWSWKLVATLVLGLSAAISMIAWAGIAAMHRESIAEDREELLGFRALNSTIQKSLDPRFVDANGDLVADPPASSGDFLSPETLVLAHYLGDDEGKLRVDWDALRKKLAEATGREVTVQAYIHTPEEVEAVAAGRIHLLAAHSAEIPSNVNSAGLVPFAELGTDQATDGNRLLIAAVPDDSIRTLADLRGKKLVCTSPESITGYRAAIVAIYLETGMVPVRDYKIAFSHKHDWSARGLAVGKFQIVALSNDMVKQMVRQDRLRETEFRVLYRSEPIPRLTIGHTHNLAPDIVDAVAKAVLEFENRGGEPYRFQPVDYRRDYEFVRRLDDAFAPRFGDVFMVDETL